MLRHSPVPALLPSQIIAHAATSSMTEQPSFYIILCGGRDGQSTVGLNKCIFSSSAAADFRGDAAYPGDSRSKSTGRADACRADARRADARRADARRAVARRAVARRTVARRAEARRAGARRADARRADARRADARRAVARRPPLLILSALPISSASAAPGGGRVSGPAALPQRRSRQILAGGRPSQGVSPSTCCRAVDGGPGARAHGTARTDAHLCRAHGTARRDAHLRD